MDWYSQEICVCDHCIKREKCATAIDLDYSLNLKQKSMLAIRRGNLEYIENAISFDTFVCPKDIFDLSHLAIRQSVFCIAKLLIPLLKERINDLDEEDCTLLQLALSKSNVSLVKYLIKYGADVNIKNGCGETALHCAVSKIWVKEHLPTRMPETFISHICSKFTLIFIEKSADLNVYNRDRFTPLHKAVLEGNIDVATILLKRGADANSVSPQGTPLHIAVNKQDVNLVRKLISSRARVTALNSTGDTVIHLALRSSHVYIQELSCDAVDANDINILNQKGENVLHVGIMNADVSILRMLIAKGADVNSLNKYGNTPLMQLVLDHFFVNFKYCCNPDGFRINHVCRFKSIAELFIDNRCDLNIRNNSGHTIFHLVLMNEGLCAIEMLLRSKIDESLLNELLFFIPFGHSHVNTFTTFIKYLVEFGADINSKSESCDRSILHEAVCDPLIFVSTVSMISFVTTLIDLGADINAVDKNGETPLHLVLKNDPGHDRIWTAVRILLEAGANINIASKDSITSLDIAEQLDNKYWRGSVKIIKKGCYYYALKYFALGWQPLIDEERISGHYLELNRDPLHFSIFSNCQKEVIIMKEIKVDGISLFDFIHPDNINNWEDRAIDFLENIDKYLIRLPNYRSFIKSVINRARRKKERQLILDSGIMFLNFVSEYYGLPNVAMQHCYKEIFKYLGFNDYKNLFILLKKK